MITRRHLFPLLIFAAGLGVGIAATGYAPSPEPARPVEESDLAERADDSTAQQAAELAAQEASPASAAAVTREETMTEAGGPPSREPNLEARLQAMTSAWAQLRKELTSLRAQVNDLQRRLPAATDPPATAEAPAAGSSRSSTPEDRRSALVTAGVDADRAADIVWRQGQQELDRLELRDIAAREGWLGSDRYREELDRIDQDALDLRREIGEDSYDRYLFASGADNRVEVASIIPGSTAEDASLQPGDLIESYGDRRVFRFTDLRDATSDGERDELVPVRIRRGDELLDLWLPRGPLGVRIDQTRVDPEA